MAGCEPGLRGPDGGSAKARGGRDVRRSDRPGVAPAQGPPFLPVRGFTYDAAVLRGRGMEYIFRARDGRPKRHRSLQRAVPDERAAVAADPSTSPVDGFVT